MLVLHWTVALQFPYYTFVDRSKMYSIGSLFYAIYFFVSFPMFMRIDEEAKGRRWSLGEVSSRHTRWHRKEQAYTHAAARLAGGVKSLLMYTANCSPASQACNSLCFCNPARVANNAFLY